MNWEAVGAIGEVVGAVGIILTIAFLALQIRQNSSLLKNNTRQLEQNYKIAVSQALAKAAGSADSMLVVAQSNELSNIIHKGLANYRELDRESAMRFSMAMGPIIATVSSSVMEQRELGVVDDKQVLNQLNFIMRFIDTVGGRQWWVQGNGMFPEPFIKIVDSELAMREERQKDTSHADVSATIAAGTS